MVKATHRQVRDCRAGVYGKTCLTSCEREWQLCPLIGFVFDKACVHACVETLQLRNPLQLCQYYDFSTQLKYVLGLRCCVSY